MCVCVLVGKQFLWWLVEGTLLRMPHLCCKQVREERVVSLWGSINLAGTHLSFFLFFFFLGTRLLMCGYEETWFPVAKLSYVPRTTVGTGTENKTKL